MKEKKKKNNRQEDGRALEGEEGKQKRRKKKRKKAPRQSLTKVPPDPSPFFHSTIAAGTGRIDEIRGSAG